MIGWIGEIWGREEKRYGPQIFSVLTHLFVHLAIWTKYTEITGEDYIYQLQIGLFFLISCVTWTKYLDYE